VIPAKKKKPRGDMQQFPPRKATMGSTYIRGGEEEWRRRGKSKSGCNTFPSFEVSLLKRSD